MNARSKKITKLDTNRLTFWGGHNSEHEKNDMFCICTIGKNGNKKLEKKIGKIGKNDHV